MKKIINISIFTLLIGFLVTNFGHRSEAKSYKKWTTVPMEESLLNLKNWHKSDECWIRIKTSANYSGETTVGFCPRWVGSEEPRTYFRIREVFPGYYVSGYDTDFSVHPLFTKWKGSRFSYFQNPVIKPGQKTTCNDSNCSFRRIEFSVKGKECQWIFSAPDYIPAQGIVISAPKTTPYAIEIFTCQTSIPLTKKHIQMKPGKVTVVWPGASQANEADNKKKTDPMSLMDDSLLCAKAVSRNKKIVWSLKSEDQSFVDEAKSRGYQVDDCLSIIQQNAPNLDAPIKEKSVSIPETKTRTPVRQAKTSILPNKTKDVKLDRRPIALQWEGKESLIAGEIEVSSEGGGKISLSLPDNDVSCSGTFAYIDRPAGIWTVACTNGEAAAGTFKGLGSGKGSTGQGTDNNGRSVKFTIGAR
jgi:hypothetical protein